VRKTLAISITLLTSVFTRWGGFACEQWVAPSESKVGKGESDQYPGPSIGLWAILLICFSTWIKSTVALTFSWPRSVWPVRLL
jgi:hypothetical protein